MELQSVIEKGVALAQRAGADGSEAYLLSSRETMVEVRNQEVEVLKVARECGLGIRIIADRRVGYAYTTDLAPEAVENTVRRALANARQCGEDRYNVLPEAELTYPRVSVYDPELERIPVGEKVELARALEREARGFDRRVKIIETCAYQDAVYEVSVVNSLGVSCSYKGTYCGLHAYVVATEGQDNQTGFALAYEVSYKDLDAGKVGREAARKAVAMLGAGSVATERMAVILDPYTTTQFLGLVAPALSSEAVQKGKSLFQGKIGKKVASELVTIIDDGTMPGRIMSSPFDGEGVPTARTVLLSGGVLQEFLYNTYTAAREGRKSTGNGVRGSFKHTPEVGTTNFYLAPGDTTPENLIKETARGLYVTEVMGMHTANPISGDFSVGVAGLLIERGELSRPVRGAAIAGNILALLEAIDGVGNDLTFFLGRGAPTVRISRMTLSSD